MKKSNSTLGEKMEPHEKAEEKIIAHNKEQKAIKTRLARHNKKRIEEFDLCLTAAICPICGKDLYLDRREIKKLFVRFTQYRYGRIKCLSGCRFVHPEVGNVSSPKSVKYMNCINYDILKAHHNLVCYRDNDWENAA